MKNFCLAAAVLAALGATTVASSENKVLGISSSEPNCTLGSLNLVVVNKDITGCHGGLEGNFCLMSSSLGSSPWYGTSCNATNPTLFAGHNESVSFPKPVKTAILCHGVVNGAEGKTLCFKYDNGVVSDNCAEVFGSEGRCTVKKSGDNKHVVYTWTMESAGLPYFVPMKSVK